MNMNLFNSVVCLFRGTRHVAGLRTVPTIVTAHIFCACQGSRARRKRNAQQAGHADCLLYVWEVRVISVEKMRGFTDEK